MGLHFGSEVLFLNAYYGLGDITARSFKQGEDYLGITLERGTAVLVSTPFFRHDDHFYILRRYSSILMDNIEILFKKGENCNFNPMYSKYDYQEEQIFPRLVMRYAEKPITKERVDKVNLLYEHYPSVVNALVESNIILRKELNCYNEH